MTNKKNWLGILVILLVFGLSIVGCGGKSNSIEGTWVDNDGSGRTLTFDKGTITHLGTTGTYTTRGNRITVTVHGVSHTGPYS